MNVENITAVLRPRSVWESADLGAALVRRDYGAVLLRQAILFVPIWAVISLAFMGHPGGALLIFWLLKPIYERVPLYYLSRALFGTQPTVRETIKESPRLFFRDLGMGLGWSRITLVAVMFWLGVSGISSQREFKILVFLLVLSWVIIASISRSVFQPVNQLEGLRGSAFRSRMKVLGQHASGGGLSTVMSLLEGGLAFSLVALITLLMPFTQAIDWREVALSLLRFEATAIPTDVFWYLNGIYLLTVFLITPFYSGAGFAIYINARTLLEGWDIELALRRLGERLSVDEPAPALKKPVLRRPPKPPVRAALVAFFLGVFGFGGAFSGSASAAPDPDQVITEVLADPDFEIHKETLQVPVPRVEDLELLGKPKIPAGASAFGDVLFYGLIAGGIAGIIWLIVANARHLIGDRENSQTESKARTVMGMEIAADSLPDDIPAAARSAWAAGDTRRAVSLLYRGAICWLVERGNVKIRESDTEHDCLTRTRASLRDPGRTEFFVEVTGHWVMQAYGSTPPHEDAFESVCSRWPFHLNQAPEVPAAVTSPPQQAAPAG